MIQRIVAGRARPLRVLAALLILFAGTVWALRRADAMSGGAQSMDDMVFVPSAPLMKVASLGYDNLVSDILWLRTIRYVYNQQKASNSFDRLNHILEVVSELDPYSCEVYERGGCWLYQDAGKPADAVRFLNKGLCLVPEQDPQRWKLAFHIGKCYREVLFDESRATSYFEMAWNMPSAPRSLITAVAAGYQRQGDFNRAIALWEQARDDIDRAQVPADFDINVHRAMVAQQAADVLDKLLVFQRRFGYRPTDLRSLVAVGLLQELPAPSVVFQLRLMEIKAAQEMMQRLQQKVSTFKEQFGHLPKEFSEMIQAGLLYAVPEPAITDAGGQGRFEIGPSGQIKYCYTPQELL